MKKILITTLLILIAIPSYTYATWACLIKDKSAEALLDFIKENRKVVKNVTKAVVKYKNSKDIVKEDKWFLESKIDWIKKDYNQSKNEKISIFNEMFNFNWYFSYFKYYVTHPISNEVPYEVKRDYKLLEIEYEWLIWYIKKLDKWRSYDALVIDPCEWVKKKCDIELEVNMKAKDVILRLIKNTSKILDLYRLTIIWDTSKFDSKWLFLVDNNFELEINKNYWIDAVSACNSSKWWFFDTISTAIQNVKILNKLWKDWTKKWKDAWGLLIWKKTSIEKIKEKKMLRWYLSNLWISMGNQNIMLNNLERYNQEWFSLNNNFITNTINSTFSKVSWKLTNWKNAVVWDFFTKNKEVVTDDISKVTNNSDISINIKEKISKMYNDELPYSAIWDVSTEKLRAKIIETHMSLDDSINTLDDTIEISRKVCNSQDQWEWICK